MAISPITEFMNSEFDPDKAEGLFYDACVEAFARGWTFMESSFQLGSRAKELGINSDRVEHLLREGFEKAQRKAAFGGDSAEAASTSRANTQSGTTDAQSMAAFHPFMKRRQALRSLNIESQNIPWPADDWRKDFIKLLSICFQPTDNVAITKNKESKSSIQLVKDLLADENKLLKISRSFDGETGAWLRLNSTLGDRESDLSRYKYVLVESRRMELGMQLAYLKAVNLPCTAVVNVGGKYLQAWVDISAFDRTDYLAKVSVINRVCKENDFEVNTYDGDPLAFVSIPGSLIGGKQCHLMESNIGAEDFEKWQVWANDYLDGDPLIEEAQEYEEPPAKTLELLNDMFRQSHKVILVGDKNTGKSWLSIDMALAIAHGRSWMDIATEESRVLYVNMELDSSSFVQRVWEVARGRGETAKHPNLDFLHLLGVEKNVAEFGDLISKRVRGAAQWEQKEYTTIIIDGMPKLPGFSGTQITTSGENISLALSLDKIVALTGAAVVLVLDPTDTLSNQPREDYHIRLNKTDSGALAVLGQGRHYEKTTEFQCRFDYPCFELA